ncbi:MAG: hypothetical protein ACRECI_12855, partial [Methyloceanibacter sp.]
MLQDKDRIFKNLYGLHSWHLRAARARGAWDGTKAIVERGHEKIIEEVKASGLRGRGGAGFPTGIKWQTVLRAPGALKYVVCNADEGDSGTFSDRMVMEGDPFVLVEGMTIAAFATGASKGYIYIRSEYPHAAAAMEAAIAAARAEGLLGPKMAGAGFAFDME